MKNLDIPINDVYILGISAFYHDSGVALIKNGEILGAVQEERFSRVKGDSSLPEKSILYLLKSNNIKPEDIKEVVFYESPFIKFDRLISTQLIGRVASLPNFVKSMATWLPDKLWVEKKIKKLLGKQIKVSFLDHHLSHGASAFYPSPFTNSAILTIDGVGEWSTSTISYGEGSAIKMLKQIEYPNSLGLLYSAFTVLCGFKVNSGEYKLMGLAPYGNPVYKDIIFEKVVNLNKDGSFSLNPEYFSYFSKGKTYNKKFEDLFGVKTRRGEERLTQVYCDIAASIQAVTNEVVLALASQAKVLTNSNNIVLAGGVALNVVTIGALERSGLFDGIWVQPASGDAGGSLGAALWLSYNKFNIKREIKQEDSMKGSFLGPFPGEVDVESLEILNQYKLIYHELRDDELAFRIAEEIANGKVVSVAKGRMEFGPRALGSRSVLADARDTEMQKRLNLKTKFREGFRPFAPMVLEEDFNNYFNGDSVTSPYMLKTYPVNESIRVTDLNENPNFEKLDLFEIVSRKRSSIPAVTHIDYSARAQTIDQSRNPFIYQVISNFKKITGCSVIVNTSFNVRGEPIVCSSRDAIECFIQTDIDVLVLDSYIIVKNEQKNLKNKSNRKFKDD